MLNKLFIKRLTNHKSFTTMIISLLFTWQTSSQTSSKETVYQPPIPVEIMAGSNSSMYEMVVTKNIMNSKFIFYNLINYEVDYDETTPNNYIVQTIIFYDLSKGFSFGLGGNIQAFNPFKPMIALSYGHFTENISIVVQPSYEIDKNGAFGTYALFEWTANNKNKFQPYIKISAYTSWKETHSFSYNSIRLGLNYKSFRFGPALNIQYHGKDANNSLNFGGFVNILLQ